MPRINWKVRTPRVDATRHAVIKKFRNRWTMFALEPENFFDELPDPKSRAAFMQAFPTDALWMFRFRAQEIALNDVEYGLDFFKRPMEFFAGEFPGLGFEPPDLRKIEPGGFRWNHLVALAQARGKWFVDNGFPITEEEQKWLAEKEHHDNRKNG